MNVVEGFVKRISSCGVQYIWVELSAWVCGKEFTTTPDIHLMPTYTTACDHHGPGLSSHSNTVRTLWGVKARVQGYSFSFTRLPLFAAASSILCQYNVPWSLSACMYVISKYKRVSVFLCSHMDISKSHIRISEYYLYIYTCIWNIHTYLQVSVCVYFYVHTFLLHMELPTWTYCLCGMQCSYWHMKVVSSIWLWNWD